MSSRKSRSKSATPIKSSLITYEENFPPWPEWSDRFIASVVWDPTEVVPVKKGTAQTAKSSKAGKAAKISVTRSDAIGDEEKYYNDGWSQKTDLFGEKVAKWERAAKIDSLTPALVHDFNQLSLDLITKNMHLMKNELIKEIVEAVSCLYTASFINPFPVEFSSGDFRPPSEIWKPWNHIYSQKSQGTGYGHFPSYNQYGRYIVRLYFLGKWRRIEVDDFLPIDLDGNLMVPVSFNGDLWFSILSKALLWLMTVFKEGKNITVVTALTGWIKLSTNIFGADHNEVWNVCCSHLLKKNELLPLSSEDIHCSYYGSTCLNDVRHLSESKIQKVYVFARIMELTYNLEDVEPEKRKLLTYVSQVTQNWIRVKEYPPWKEYRWFDWAYRHNILKGKIGDIFKQVYLYTPLWIESNKGELNPDDLLSPTFVETFQSNYFKEWAFDKFIRSVEYLELYYLPSQFENVSRAESFSFLLSNEAPENSSNIRSTSKTVDHNKSKHGILSLSRFIDQSAFSFYLLADSPYCKRIYLDMMFYHSDEKTDGHVICEKFRWDDDTQVEPVFFAKTIGSTCNVITSGPGRHIFRFWCKVPQPHFVQFLSNTPFVFKQLEALQESLLEDSVSYNLYGNQISECFRELVKAEYGSESHSQALKKYVESFYPTDLRQKSHLHQNLIYRIPFDKLLEESITDFILETDTIKSPEKATYFVQKMKKLFLNPVFGEDILMVCEPDANEIPSVLTTVSAKSATTKSTVAKSATKGKNIQPALDLYFDIPENNIKVLKNIMSKEKSFLSLYPFCYDGYTKIVFHEYKGKTEIQSLHSYYIVARLLMNLHTSEVSSCGIFSLFHNDYFRICIYDISTMDEVPIKFDRNSIWKLTRSEMGFVILLLCYNLNLPVNKQSEQNWRIRVLSSDESSLLHPCHWGLAETCNFIPSTPINVSENIQGYYLPNPKNIVFKFLIIVTQSDIVTLQLSVSNEDAEVAILISGSNDFKVKESEGKGSVLMPSIILDLENAHEEEGKHYFQGQVRVLYNSWIFSNEESTFIDQVKENYVPFSDILSNTKAKRKKSSRFSSILSTDNIGTDSRAPTWTLTMITEQGPRDKVTKLVADQRIFDHFKAATMSIPPDPQRLRKGLDLRAQFRATHNQIESDDTLSTSTHFIEHKFEHFENLISSYCLLTQ